MLHDENVNNETIVNEQQEVIVRISQRERRSVISDDHVVYLQESEMDLEINNDPDSIRWEAAASSTFNVLDYNAVGDGKTDDSEVFLKAWRDVCEATKGMPTLILPSGRTFLLKPIIFQGPCKSTYLHFQIQGSILAPNDVTAWENDKTNWLQFSDVNGLMIDGGGQIDGQGSVWWKQSLIWSKSNPFFFFFRKIKASHDPRLSFHNCNALQLSKLRHVNSQRNHISINGCNGVDISELSMIAPEESPNTDGIDISASSHINIRNSLISTGDDCIAINGFTSNINISGVLCGPGHGISVGSLGKNGAYETVEDIHVENCTFNGTQNGVRIKTWPGGSGYARRISFEQINLIASQNPIIIDQNYWDHFQYGRESSDVHISDVTYREIRGTSADLRAISLNCGKSTGCSNIVMDNIDIIPSTPGMQLYAFCNNAYGSSTSASPNVPCLSKRFDSLFHR
eukprot:XP_025015122.1 probable polygalacturonase At3g15720 [Ricinus communis]